MSVPAKADINRQGLTVSVPCGEATRGGGSKAAMAAHAAATEITKSLPLTSFDLDSLNGEEQPTGFALSHNENFT